MELMRARFLQCLQIEFRLMEAVLDKLVGCRPMPNVEVYNEGSFPVFYLNNLFLNHTIVLRIPLITAKQIFDTLYRFRKYFSY